MPPSSGDLDPVPSRSTQICLTPDKPKAKRIIVPISTDVTVKPEVKVRTDPYIST
jgi:hypothetical protein